MPNLPISSLPELTAVTNNAEYVVEQSGVTYKFKNSIFRDTYFPITGGTVSGNTNVTGGLTANTISATTYQNLPATPFLPLSGGTVTGATSFTNGLTANTISATTYQNLPATPFLPLSGGTVSGQLILKYNTSPLLITTTNYSPGVSGNILYFYCTTGITYSAINSRTNGGASSGNLVLQESLGDNVGIGKEPSSNFKLDVKGTIGSDTISATTYQNLPATPFLPLSGGTVTGATSFTNGLTANTISATTIVISGVTVNPKQTIALFFGHDSLSPGDTQTYFIGNSINLTAPISGSDGRRVIIPKTGNIVRVDICQTVGGTLGSSETSTFTVNNVTQSTSSTITTTYTYDASSANIAYNLSSPLAVTVNDKIEIRWTTPAWVTNPTTIRQQMNVYLEY